MDLLLDEPGSRRLFVNTMQGLLYAVSYDGKTVKPYLDLNDPKWAHPVQFTGRERGFQSFAFHPQFTEAGAPGAGKFYTYFDTTDMTPTADFVPLGSGHTHDEILLEWTAKDPKAPAYDGGAPRELFRIAHPFPNHNGGEIAFNPLARPGSAEFGLLYIGSADGGSAGDPYNHAQNLKSVFGKILRIDPLGRNSANGKYGIPDSNPFVTGAKPETVKEIYAVGVRNPQRFSWDSKSGTLYLGTYDSSTYWRTLPQITSRLQPLLGADLYRTQDGRYFSPVTMNGFGDPFSFGFRNFVDTPGGFGKVPHGPQYVLSRDPERGVTRFRTPRGVEVDYVDPEG